MAGIGFELRRILNNDNYLSLIGAYAYAGLITSGPWILAILLIFCLSFLAHLHGVNSDVLRGFQSIVVYCVAGSLILSSIFQHSYTRYIADQLYLHKMDQIIPSLNSIYSFILFTSGILGSIFVYFFLPDQSVTIKILVISSFTILNLIWVTTSVLSGLLAYKTIFIAFASNFVATITSGYFLQFYGLDALLLSFLTGQFILLMILNYAIYNHYPSQELINYHFYRIENVKIPLFFTGLFYNIGIWIDKFLFWFSPSTGSAVIGNLHESIVYDLPIFIAYIAIIPGTIIFLMHMETDYAMAHENLYKKINGHYTLSSINSAYIQLLQAGRRAIFSVIKAQSYILLIGISIGSTIFVWLNISLMYLPMFCICLLAASLNVVFWAILDLIFYLDQITEALLLTIVFTISNTLFTALSIHFGILYFGYGLTASLLLTDLVGFILLNRKYSDLVYYTYVRFV